MILVDIELYRLPFDGYYHDDKYIYIYILKINSETVWNEKKHNKIAFIFNDE